MIKPFISCITVTGVDDSVAITDMHKIHARYPFVEFGILLSQKYSTKNGAHRFPSWTWLNDLMAWQVSQVDARDKFRLSGHLCGHWVHEILMGRFDLSLINPGFADLFTRFQINTHAEPHGWDAVFLGNLIDELHSKNQTVIFQIDGRNKFFELLTHGGQQGIAGLYDLSHGAGRLPSEWPKQIDNTDVGYAGGLSPQNVAEQCEKIYPQIADRSIWIDAETHLRSDDGTAFDVAKCMAFLENAKPYVI